jgi:hypothetical protein
VAAKKAKSKKKVKPGSAGVKATPRTGQPAHKGKSEKIGKSHPVVSNRLSKDEKKFVKLLLDGNSVRECEHAMNLPEKMGYKIMARPRVKRFLEKAGRRVEELMVEKVAVKVVDMLEIADGRLTEILQSPEHPFFGYKDVLTAIKLCYQRRAAIPKAGDGAQPSPNVQQTNVTVNLTPTAEKAIRNGIGTYEPQWVRQQYGINDPASDAIEQSFGGLQPPLPALPLGSSAGDPEETVEAGDEAATLGAE